MNKDSPIEKILSFAQTKEKNNNTISEVKEGGHWEK